MCFLFCDNEEGYQEGRAEGWNQGFNEATKSHKGFISPKDAAHKEVLAFRQGFEKGLEWAKWKVKVDVLWEMSEVRSQKHLEEICAEVEKEKIAYEKKKAEESEDYRKQEDFIFEWANKKYLSNMGTKSG